MRSLMRLRETRADDPLDVIRERGESVDERTGLSWSERVPTATCLDGHGHRFVRGIMSAAAALSAEAPSSARRCPRGDAGASLLAPTLERRSQHGCSPGARLGRLCLRSGPAKRHAGVGDETATLAPRRVLTPTQVHGMRAIVEGRSWIPLRSIQATFVGDS
jgi:hypothetical protein